MTLWQRYQDWLYYNEDLGFYLDISRISFTDELVKELEPKFTKAFDDIEALESGEQLLQEIDKVLLKHVEHQL